MTTMVQELIFELKKCWPLHLLKATIAALLLLVIHLLVAFSVASGAVLRQVYNKQSEYDLVEIQDAFMDDNENFYEFRQDAGKLLSLAEFYDALNSSVDPLLVSAFSQPIPVEGFKGSEEFGYSYGSYSGSSSLVVDEEGTTYFNAKAAQLNFNAYEFYGLSVQDGEELDWSSIDYAGDATPVLLGSSYEGVYALGDVLEGIYYGRAFTFKVVGILEPAATVFQQGNADYSLDTSIVVPYPARLRALNYSSDDGFEGILAFAAINCELAVPCGGADSTVLSVLEKAASKSGFSAYRVVGMTEYAVQLSLMRHLFEQGGAAVYAIVGLLAVSASIAIALIDLALQGHRASKALAMSICGEEVKNVASSMTLGFISSWLVGLISYLALQPALMTPSFFSALVTLACGILLAFVDCILQGRLVVRRLRRN